MPPIGTNGQSKTILQRFRGDDMDREELEERVNNALDDREKELEQARAVIRKLDAERLNEILGKGGDRE